MRSAAISKLLAAVAVSAICANLATAAEAPTPKDCMSAYATLNGFRMQVRKLEATPGSSFHGLGAFVDGFDLIDFRARAETLDKKFPDASWQGGGGAFGASLATGNAQDRLIGESTSAALSALIAPEKTFAEQRTVFARARACDIAYGFAPALGETPAPERTIALLREQGDRRVKEKNDRLAALDDKQCAIRFALASNLFPPGTPGQQLMNERTGAAASNAIAAQPDMPRERFAQMIQRDLLERAEKFKSGSYKSNDLIEEVNACERRLGMTVTELNE